MPPVRARRNQVADSQKPSCGHSGGIGHSQLLYDIEPSLLDGPPPSTHRLGILKAQEHDIVSVFEGFQEEREELCIGRVSDQPVPMVLGHKEILAQMEHKPVRGCWEGTQERPAGGGRLDDSPGRFEIAPNIDGQRVGSVNTVIATFRDK